jgi:hypothetical protein
MSRYLSGAEENQENLNADRLTKGQDLNRKPIVYEQECYPLGREVRWQKSSHSVKNAEILE